MICSICCCSFCLDIPSYVLLVFGCLLQTYYDSSLLSILFVFLFLFQIIPCIGHSPFFVAFLFLFITPFTCFFSLIIALNVFHLDQHFSFYAQLYVLLSFYVLIHEPKVNSIIMSPHSNKHSIIKTHE